MTTENYQYVIIGGGTTAGYAAKAFVEAGLNPDELLILSAENVHPYNRPPLSKGYLRGETPRHDVFVNEPEFYEKHGIDVRLGTPATAVDLRNRVIGIGVAESRDPDREKEPAATVGYQKLLIATGASPRTFDLPGADLDGLFYLRRLDQSRAIREAAERADTAVVIGGSFIAMETASALHDMGVETMMVFPESRVWEALFTPEISEFFEDAYRERGVDIISGVGIEKLEGNGRVERVVLDDGKTLATDMVVAGIGVEPNVDLFADTQLQIEDGIVVNRFLETNYPDIYAAGDVARYRDILFNKVRRVEHWDNAQAQGTQAAQAMLGKIEPFEQVPFFFSDVFDMSFEFFGDNRAADEVVHRGDLDSGSFSAWWLQDGRLCAALIMDRPDEERQLAQEWLKNRVKLDSAVLADASTPLQPVTEPA